VISRYGFTDPRRFVMAYRRAFGEAPMWDFDSSSVKSALKAAVCR